MRSERSTVPKPAVPGSGLMSLSTCALIASSEFARVIACFHSSGTGASLGGDEARAEVDADRAEHQRRRDAAPVEDAAGRHHRDRRYRVDHLRHQRHGADLPAIAAGLAALRDDDVDAALGRLDRLRDGGDLQHHARPGRMRLPHQVAGIAEREGDDGRARLQRAAKRLGVERLRNMIDGERLVGEGLHHLDVAPDRGGGPEQRADAAEAALVRHRSGELGRGGRAHRREDDRNVDAEEITQACPEHASSPVSAAYSITLVGARPMLHPPARRPVHR